MKNKNKNKKIYVLDESNPELESMLERFRKVEIERAKIEASGKARGVVRRVASVVRIGKRV